MSTGGSYSVTVVVTEEDISLGRRQTGNCPQSRALKRLGYKKVDTQWMNIRVDGENLMGHLDWDEFWEEWWEGEKQVSPATFEIDGCHCHSCVLCRFDPDSTYGTADKL